MSSPDPAATSPPLTFLCLASYEKGHRTLEELKRQGCRVYLLTSLSLKDKANWPRESLEDVLYMPDRQHAWNLDDMVKGISHLARSVHIDRIMALDDFDLEKAALLREHLRLPGLGETATRYFRDKLAMRIGAARAGHRVPEFTATFNYKEISDFLENVPGPWVLKPRLMAGAIGIKKLHQAQEVWDRIASLGDEQSYFILERFIPGDIFHVDSVWFRGEMVYANSSAYGTPPLELTTGGGIFTTQILEHGGEADRELRSLNEQVLRSFGLTDGVSHTEFIRSHADGSYYFLETSARVGGAHIADLIEQAAGVDLWCELAKLEVALARSIPYRLPPVRSAYAGLLVSLARQEWPDISGFADPELVWRLKKPNHIGFIVKSSRRERVEELLAAYTERVRTEFQASAPPRDTVNE
ncbi:MAG: ATPase [Acidobacteriota bacterium]|nr:ATPase [Acidobacteriota bacterium]